MKVGRCEKESESHDWKNEKVSEEEEESCPWGNEMNEKKCKRKRCWKEIDGK